jgi:DNA-binding response OmpR family regulator
MDSKILIVDDEPLLVKGLKYSLEQDGYLIESASDGREALNKYENQKYDLIILDLMLPEIDGLEVCQRIREKSDTPIIMLTAKGEDMNKILGLEYGADDYMTKPFNILELKARVKAILRRSATKNSNLSDQIMYVDDFIINTLGRKVIINGKEIGLTAKEFDLLILLATNPGNYEYVLTKWGVGYYFRNRT